MPGNPAALPVNHVSGAHLIRSVSVPTARLRPRPALTRPLLRKKKPFELLKGFDQAALMT